MGFARVRCDLSGRRERRPLWFDRDGGPGLYSVAQDKDRTAPDFRFRAVDPDVQERGDAFAALMGDQIPDKEPQREVLNVKEANQPFYLGAIP